MSTFKNLFKKPKNQQFIPLSLTILTAGILISVVFAEVIILNKIIPVRILLKINPSDVLVGMIIYLKTSVDFAIFIGNLMANYKGVKNRIAIEIGTAA